MKNNFYILNRRQLIKSSLVATAATFVNFKSLFAKLTLTDQNVKDKRILGDDNARISVIEYFSMTCGHCADFHNDTFPKLKTNLIEKGVINFEMRPFPLDGLALRAHAICRAVSKKKYYYMVKSFLSDQDKWIKSDDPIVSIKKIARKAGISEKTYNYIMSNKPYLEEFIKEREYASQKYGITSTPSFVINNSKVIKGSVSYTEFLKKLNEFNI